MSEYVAKIIEDDHTECFITEEKITRCKDCIYNRIAGIDKIKCILTDTVNSKMGFCNHGREKDDE